MKIFIWGTGNTVNRILIALSPETEVLGYIDNNKEKQNLKLNGKKIYNPEIICEEDFDYIIISAYVKYKEISDQLEQMGISAKKIIQFFNYSKFFPRTFFYNAQVVKDDNYKLLFRNYIDVRMGG